MAEALQINTQTVLPLVKFSETLRTRGAIVNQEALKDAALKLAISSLGLSANHFTTSADGKQQMSDAGVYAQVFAAALTAERESVGMASSDHHYIAGLTRRAGNTLSGLSTEDQQMRHDLAQLATEHARSINAMSNYSPDQRVSAAVIAAAIVEKTGEQVISLRSRRYAAVSRPQ